VAIAALAVLYIGIQVVCAGHCLNWLSPQKPLADAGGRFRLLVERSAGAVISITGNLNLVLSGSHIPFAMANTRTCRPWLAAFTDGSSRPTLPLFQPPR
jgi:hypothetical protein